MEHGVESGGVFYWAFPILPMEAQHMQSQFRDLIYGHIVGKHNGHAQNK